jgi:hypothetical protein
VRENRTHGSEVGGTGTTGPSYPYCFRVSSTVSVAIWVRETL